MKRPFALALSLSIALGALTGCGLIFGDPESRPGRIPGTWERQEYGSIGGMNQDRSWTIVFEPSGIVRFTSTNGQIREPDSFGKWTKHGDTLSTTLDTCVVFDESQPVTQHDCVLGGDWGPLWDPGNRRVYAIVDGIRHYYSYKGD